VTAGLGVLSTLTWNGSSKTAPEIPAGVATTAMTNAAAKAATSLQPVPSTRQTYPGGGVRHPRAAHCAARLRPMSEARACLNFRSGREMRATA
jgi:hypothetical protein